MKLSTIFSVLSTGQKPRKLVCCTCIGVANLADIELIGLHLGKLLIEAVDELATQKAILKELEETIPAAYIAKWEKMVYNYERDSTQPDPFSEKANGWCYLLQ
jgi:hypothetical protein